jgi:hypothetical protein
MTGSTLWGHVDVVDPTTGIGVVRDEHGARFRFGRDDFVMGSSPALGQRVAFSPGTDGRAERIRLVASTVGSFELGRVVRRTLWLMRRRWALGVTASAVLVGAASAAQQLGHARMASDLSTWVYWLGLIGSQIGHYLFVALMAGVAIGDLRGARRPVNETLSKWAMAIAPLCALGALATLGIFGAYLLVIIPGIMLSLSWSVAAPVLMIERRRVIESLRRSRDLTSGYRWKIFGLFLAYGLLWWIVRFALRAVVHAAIGQRPETQIACDAVVRTLGGVVVALGISALYYELLTVKEGDEPDEVAAVFD